MPIDLSTELWGLRLRNPLILGSGEMGNSGTRLKEAAQAGFGAVVTKTIGPRKGAAPPPTSPRMWAYPKIGTLVRVSGASPYLPQDWYERELPAALQGGVPVAANVGVFLSQYLDKWDLAEMKVILRRMQETGISWFEFHEGHDLADAATREKWGDFVIERLTQLKKFIDIPIVIKLVYRYPADMVKLAQRVEAAGADALVIGHSLDGIDIDPETGRLVAAIGQLGRSSFSGRGSFSYWLNLLFQVCQHVKIPVIGGHGVWGWEELVKQTMAGAKASQMLSYAMVKGLGVVRQTLRGLEAFMKKKGYSSLEEFRGIALRPERLRESTKHIAEVNEELCTGCGACSEICYGSILAQEQPTRGWFGPRIKVNSDKKIARVDKDLCEGCQACVSVCPKSAIALQGWPPES